jgi:glucokinase
VLQRLAIGIDIGGTKVKAGVIDEDGRVLESILRDTPSTSPRQVEEAIAEIVADLRHRHYIVALGIGAAGFIDASRSTVLFSPHLAWRNEPLRDAVRRRVGLSTVVDNDANCAAWAEWRFGAAQNETDLVCLTLGTGIGGGLVFNGQVHRGKHGISGEFGHMQVVRDGHECECGNRGCWEQYASANALVREARRIAESGGPDADGLLRHVDGDVDAITGIMVTTLALEGDQTCIRLIAEMGDWLGVGIANLAAAIDPGTFVIGGGVSGAGELLLTPAVEAFRRTLTGRGFRPEARVVLAHLGNQAGMIGAADLARTASRRGRRRSRSARRAGTPIPSRRGLGAAVSRAEARVATPRPRRITGESRRWTS